jgi:hypothetical protein
MATTCKLIAKNTLGSDTGSVTFSSIPATYTDLLLLASIRSDRSAAVADWIKLRFNGAASDTSHDSRALYGSGSAAASLTDPSARIGYAAAASATADTFGNFEVYIPNYAGSTNKSYSATGVAETNASAQFMAAVAGLWSSTNAINQIQVLPDVGTNLKSGSSFFLYGILKA